MYSKPAVVYLSGSYHAFTSMICSLIPWRYAVGWTSLWPWFTTGTGICLLSYLTCDGFGLDCGLDARSTASETIAKRRQSTALKEELTVIGLMPAIIDYVFLFLSSAAAKAFSEKWPAAWNDVSFATIFSTVVDAAAKSVPLISPNVPSSCVASFEH